MFGLRGLCKAIQISGSRRFQNRSLFLELSRNFRNEVSTTTAVKKKRLGTHNGSFHCDEALACFLICLSGKFSGAQIVRTRDSQVLETLDAVLEIGGVYAPGKDRYDHHQKGFTDVFGHGFDTKLSAAGLVYKHYGLEIIAKELQLDQGHPDVHQLFLATCKNFIELKLLLRSNDGVTANVKALKAVDAIDNGIPQYDTDQTPRYKNNMSLSYRIGRLNLDWIEPSQSSEKEDEAFHWAIELTSSDFLGVHFIYFSFVYTSSIHFHAKSWLPTRAIVMECLAARQDIDPRGEIMVLKKQCPWKIHIFELEDEMKIGPHVKYVLYQVLRHSMGFLTLEVTQHCRACLQALWLRDNCQGIATRSGTYRRALVVFSHIQKLHQGVGSYSFDVAV